MRTGMNDARRATCSEHTDLPRPGSSLGLPQFPLKGLTARRPWVGDRVAATRPHEDTAQSSGYVVLAGWSIEHGYSLATAARTLRSSAGTLKVRAVFPPGEMIPPETPQITGESL